jgi:hypothetical protein
MEIRLVGTCRWIRFGNEVVAQDERMNGVNTMMDLVA